MKVSIIITVYNGEKYLEECIDSAVNQTYQDTEIFAVDDGSTDGSPDILKKYSNKIKIITKENGGLSSALNAGIKASTGEWIKTLDNDDVLYPNAIEELILEAKNLQNKKNTVLYANYDIIDAKGKIVDQVKEPNYNELAPFDFNVILLDHNMPLPTSSLIHRSTMEEYGMFDETISYEDYELWLRYCLIHNCRLRLVEKTVAKYRIHQGQTTKVKVRKALDQTNKIRMAILAKLTSAEREKYKNSLKQYKKSKPTIVKIMYFVRYNLISVLPRPLSIIILNVYWFMRRKKF